MLRIPNIGNEGNQDILIDTLPTEIVLNIRYMSQVQRWYLGLTYGNLTISGVKLSLGVLHIIRLNAPFDFIVIDNSTLDIDPYLLTDFSSGRCDLYMLEPSEILTFRGLPVAIQ